MNRLVFPGSEFRNFRLRMLAESPLESVGAVIARVGRGKQSQRFIVIETAIAEPEDYVSRSQTGAVAQPKFVARALRRARDENACLFLAHTHPFEDFPHFSRVDKTGELTIASTLYGRAPLGPHGSLVIGATGFAARLIDRGGKTTELIERLLEVSANVRLCGEREGDDPAEIFDRNVRAFGKDGQLLLNRLHVAVVGVGGTGSFVVEELARLGVGRLTLIDDEDIESTNLNRIVGSTESDVGKRKVDVLAAVAKRARKGIEVNAIAGSILRESVARRLIDCDLVFCCTDSHGSRAVINQVAYQYLVPTLDIGVRIDAAAGTVTTASTRVQLLAPGLACLACHPLLSADAVRRDLFSPEQRAADPYIVGFQEPQPAVVSINGSVSSSAVTMFLTCMTGLPGSTRHLVGQPLEGTVRAVVAKPRLECVVCGANNAYGRADSWPLMWIK